MARSSSGGIDDDAHFYRKTWLICPKCAHRFAFEVMRALPEYPVSCPECGLAYDIRVLRVRAKSSRGSRAQNRRSFSIRVLAPTGAEDLIEFENAGYHDFELRSRDTLIASYRKGRIVQVYNVNVARYMTISNPRCFVASWVFGPGSDEVDALRAFRDQTLLEGRAGRAFVSAYYRCGPRLVRAANAIPGSRRALRSALRVFVRLARPHPGTQGNRGSCTGLNGRSMRGSVLSRRA